jgi:hypothetical protein
MRPPTSSPTLAHVHFKSGIALRSALSAALVAVAPSLAAQRAPATVQQTGAPATAARADDKRAMTVADYAKWRSIRDVAISDDGAWASFAYQQRRVDDTLYLESLTAKAEWKLPRASRVQFADDSKWVAYFVAEPMRANAPETDTPANGPARLELRNLVTGTVQSWDNVASFAFSKGSVALMIRKARPTAAMSSSAASRRPSSTSRGRCWRTRCRRPIATETDCSCCRRRTGSAARWTTRAPTTRG